MANKSIKDSFQRFWQHCVSSFATKEYVDNAVGSGGGTGGGGGGASGGLSIKKIEFTDRPSAYNWLLSNADKVIKTTLASNQAPVPLNYNTMYISYNSDGSNITFHLATTIVDVDVNGRSDVIGMLAKISSDAVEVIMTPKFITFSTGDNQVASVSGIAPTTIPDAYWSGMAAKLTFYYID